MVTVLRKGFPVILGFLLIFALSGCSLLSSFIGGGTGGPPQSGGSITMMIPAGQGGKLTVAGATLVIPPGALSADANVTLSDRGKPNHMSGDPLDYVSDAFRVDATAVNGGPVDLTSPAMLTITPASNASNGTLDLIVAQADPTQPGVTQLHHAQPAQSPMGVSYSYQKLQLSQWVVRVPALTQQPQETDILQVPWYYQSGLPWCVPTSLTEMMRYYDFPENAGDPLNPTYGERTAIANWETAAQSQQAAGKGAGYDELNKVGVDNSHITGYLWDDDFLITASGAHGNYTDFEVYIVLVDTGLFGLFDRRPIALVVDMWWHSVVIVGVDGTGLFIHDSNGPIAEHFTWDGFQSAAHGWKKDSEGKNVYVYTLYTAVLDYPVKPEVKRRGSVVIGRGDLSFLRPELTGLQPTSLDWDGQYHSHGYYFNDQFNAEASSADLGAPAPRDQPLHYTYRIANVTNVPLTFSSVAELSGPNYGDGLVSQRHTVTVQPYTLSDPITGTFNQPITADQAVFDVKLFETDNPREVEDVKFIRYTIYGVYHTAPQPVIDWPTLNLSVPPGRFQLVGHASSTEPGVLAGWTSCDHLTWSSSVNTDVIQKPSVPQDPNSFSSTGRCQAAVTLNDPGPRTIELQATNSFGDTGTATVTINVTQPQPGLTVVITQPHPNDSFTIYIGSSTSITLQGSATVGSAGMALRNIILPPIILHTQQYAWYWYPTGGDVNSKQLITNGTLANGTTTVSWQPQRTVCQQLGAHKVTVRLEVSDTLHGTAFAEVPITINCAELT